ncbi:hypothetical protein GG344DRAFT_83437 [Lentinula edodes]|nr:hypothetical protein GG344DRAFT_83437 [Lentinula edodes]
MSLNEQEELDRFLEENLRKGYIVPSKSPISSPVFFVKKDLTVDSIDVEDVEIDSGTINSIISSSISIRLISFLSLFGSRLDFFKFLGKDVSLPQDIDDPVPLETELPCNASVGFNRDVRADVPNIDLPNTTPALQYSSGVNTPAFSKFFEKWYHKDQHKDQHTSTK